jgi:hypothetical protein
VGEYNRYDLASSLEALALEIRFNDKLGEFFTENAITVSVSVTAWSPESYAELVRKLGKGKKEANDYTQSVVRTFGESFNYDYESVDADPRDYVRASVIVSRSAVCEKVPTGKKEVKLVRKMVSPAVYEEVEEEVEITEWDCKPILAPRD